jgi:prevent-host-death family protein
MEIVTTVTDAKARLSELLRRVRAGESVLILSHGKPIARICPVAPDDAGEDARLRDLEAQGLIRRGPGVDVEGLAGEEEPAAEPGASLLEALLEEREEGR